MWLSACFANFCRACLSSASLTFSAAVPYAAWQSCASCSKPVTASSLVLDLGTCVRAGTAENTHRMLLAKRCCLLGTSGTASDNRQRKLNPKPRNTQPYNDEKGLHEELRMLLCNDRCSRRIIRGAGTDCAAYLEPWQSSVRELRCVQTIQPVTETLCASGTVPSASCTVREGLV